MARRKTRTLTEVELEFMQAVWQLGECGTEDVRRLLRGQGRDLSDGSVRKVLSILMEKGYLTRRQEGRGFLYRPTVEQRKANRSLVSDLLKRACLEATAAFITAGVLAQMVKHLIGRPRPRMLAEGIQHFGPTLASGLDSFPSGHAATAFAAALALSMHYPKLSPAFMFTAAFIAVSRIFNGSHFPVDVLGGVFFGLAVGAVITIYRPQWAGSRSTIRQRRDPRLP